MKKIARRVSHTFQGLLLQGPFERICLPAGTPHSKIADGKQDQSRAPTSACRRPGGAVGVAIWHVFAALPASTRAAAAGAAELSRRFVWVEWSNLGRSYRP